MGIYKLWGVVTPFSSAELMEKAMERGRERERLREREREREMGYAGFMGVIERTI